MSTSDLDKMGLTSLSAQEESELDGGIFREIGYAIGYGARWTYEYFTAEWDELLNPSNAWVKAKIG